MTEDYPGIVDAPQDDQPMLTRGGPDARWLPSPTGSPAWHPRRGLRSTAAESRALTL